MEKILDGIRKYQTRKFQSQRNLFEKLKNGQNPSAMLISCSDSRVNPSLFTQSEPGELFEMQTAGNLVPTYETPQCGEAGTIEYAVSELRVHDLIVCGHSYCGAMNALINPVALTERPAIRKMMESAAETKRILVAKYSDITDPDELWNLSIEINVLVQLKNLRSHPSVMAAINRGELELHGWVYQFETGTVLSFDETAQGFVPIS